MFEMFHAMGLVLLGWLLWFIAFIGWGLILFRCYGHRDTKAYWLVSFWSGWALIIGILQIWHFWLPVEFYISLLILVIGIASFFINKANLQKILWIGGTKYSKWGFRILCSIIAIWLSNLSIGFPSNPDSSFYHFQVIRWIETYSIIPGLGNLEPRFGFNNTSFLYVALLDTGLWFHKGHHLATGLLLFVLLGQLLLSLFSLFKYSGGYRLYHVFSLLLIVPVVRQCVAEISSPGTDTPVMILAFIICLQLISFLLKPNLKYHSSGYSVFYIFLLSAIGVTIKVSFAFFAIPAVLVFLYLWNKNRKEQFSFYKPQLLLAIMIVAVIAISWVVRGIILTGYFVFPVTTYAFPVDWVIPKDIVMSILDDFAIWPRAIILYAPQNEWHEILDSGAWKEIWIKHVIFKRKLAFTVPVLLFIISIFGLLIHLMKMRKWKALDLKWVFFFPPLLAVIAWYLTAPDPRFSNGVLWILGAAGVAFYIHETNRYHKLSIYSAIIFVIILCIVPNWKIGLWNNAGKDGGFYPMPTEKPVEYIHPSGVIFYEQPGKVCWDTQVPCGAGRILKTIKLRKEGDIQYGFIQY